MAFIAAAEVLEGAEVVEATEATAVADSGFLTEGQKATISKGTAAANEVAAAINLIKNLYNTIQDLIAKKKRPREIEALFVKSTDKILDSLHEKGIILNDLVKVEVEPKLVDLNAVIEAGGIEPYRFSRNFMKRLLEKEPSRLELIRSGDMPHRFSDKAIKDSMSRGKLPDGMDLTLLVQMGFGNEVDQLSRREQNLLNIDQRRRLDLFETQREIYGNITKANQLKASGMKALKDKFVFI